jgi:hypothetical protein
MNESALKKFASQLDADADAIMERWQGRPDRIMDDIFRIRDIDTGQLRDLELFDVQKKLVHAYFYGDEGNLTAYKGRRIGYSFAVVASFLLEAMFVPDSFYPIVSRSLSQAKNRIDDLEELISTAKIDIPTEKVNTDYIELWNGSSFMAYSADSDTSRGGDSARAVLMDEMAFMEDEESAKQAFGAFLALGRNRKMVQISTPNTKNDLFMQDFRRGTPSGDNGVIAIKQPTFANAEDIDIHTSLYDQELKPVRPEINIDQLESERLSDPEGFGQEYLCRPVVDEYRFFDEDAIQRAQERGNTDVYLRGLDAVKPNGARRIMGVDVGINRDDTVISVMDHINDERKQRECIVVDNDRLRSIGITNPDRGNVNDIAEYINFVHREMDVDTVILDQGGVGRTFPSVLQRKLGREIINFDFSDKEAVADMMGDTNTSLLNNNMWLLPDERIFDEMSSIIKEKRDQYQKPKFSGKDHSETGKDDVAMATVLSAFPPSMSTSPATNPAARERASETPDRAVVSDNGPDGELNPSFGSGKVNRSSRGRQNRYSARNTRR